MNYENKKRLENSYSEEVAINKHIDHVNMCCEDRNRLKDISIYLRNKGHCIYPKMYKDGNYYIIKVY